MLMRFLCAAAVCLVCGASVVEVGDIDEVAPTEELTPGDWYQVKYARDGVQDDGFGMLVSADDQWVTLAFIVRGRNEQAVPVLSKTPYVNRLFKSVGISDSHVTVFVPREAVSQMTPQEAASVKPEHMRVSEFPQPGDSITVCYSKGGERLRKRGKLVSVDDQAVIVTCQEKIAQTSSVPILSQIPLVGGMFTKQTFTRRDVNTSIAADKVLSLSVTGSFIERTVEQTASLK